jgi:succinate dehydrogenase hydrophobic anchor subunit
MLVLFHAFMGVRTVVMDYTRGRTRTILVRAVYLVALVLFALGTTVVTTLPVVPRG